LPEVILSIEAQGRRLDEEQPTEDGAGFLSADDTLEWLGLNQAQVAALLGLSAQAVSKGMSKGQDASFLARDGKAQKLYRALTAIGGERYLVAAARLKEAAIRNGWGALDSVAAGVAARDLYLETKELWVFSDDPLKVVDWDALRDTYLYVKSPLAEPRLLVFFTRTLEAADRCAEQLERDLIKPAINGADIDINGGAKLGCYVYIVATNVFPYGMDFVIANPGSRCIGPATQNMTTLAWTGGSYAYSSGNCAELVAWAQQLDLGTSTVKEHFFPKGTILPKDKFDFRFRFMDGLIAVRGTEPERSGPTGEGMAGGLLRTHRSTLDRSAEEQDNTKTLENNKKMKFVPVFMQCYRRRPNESFSRVESRTLRVIRDELRAANHPEDQGTGFRDRVEQRDGFWG
jgi:hypothetical protein